MGLYLEPVYFKIKGTLSRSSEADNLKLGVPEVVRSKHGYRRLNTESSIMR
jgi:hypothetical protein